MASIFALSSMFTQTAMPDDVDSMVACAWHNLKAQNRHEFLNLQTEYSEKADAVSNQAARGGPDSTICAQVALVLCEPLQVVALKR